MNESLLSIIEALKQKPNVEELYAALEWIGCLMLEDQHSLPTATLKRKFILGRLEINVNYKTLGALNEN